MIRVAHIVGQLGAGGSEKLLTELVRHMDRDRFESWVVSLSDEGALADELRRLGCRVVAINKPSGFRLGLINTLGRWIRAHRIDVVHTHSNRALVHGGPAARIGGARRVIHTQHGRWIGDNWRQYRLFAIASRFADAMVCVSADSAEESARRGVPRNRLQVIRNGRDLASYPFRGPNPTGPAVAVSRLDPVKDLGTMLRAAALAAEQAPEFRLEIAGDGPSRDELAALVRDLGLADRVRFVGLIDDVAGFLAQGRLFAQSSLSEGISLSLIEAMATGLPVVATRVGGNPEVVPDDSVGLLVPASDPQALADAILKVWRDPSLGLAIAQAARGWVESQFEARRMIDAYETLYHGGSRAKIVA